MILPQVNPFDTDDGREIYRLLCELPPIARRAWLNGCCSFACCHTGTLGVTMFSGSAWEAMADCLTIMGQGLLNLDVAGGMLVEIYKAFEKGVEHGIRHIRVWSIYGDVHPSGGRRDSVGHHPGWLHPDLAKSHEAN